MKVSGKVASAFLSSSISILLIGILAYFRKQLPFLQVYPPTGSLGGIWLYSYLVWIVVWLITYVALRKRETVGSIKGWVAVFITSVVLSTLLVEIGLNWSSLFQ